MAMTDPETIVRTALAKGELDRLLLGTPEYQYRSKYSSAPGNTDLTELLDALYDRLDPKARETSRDALTKALYSLIGSLDGVYAVASCILFEAVRNSSGNRTLGLPLDDLARRLRSTIRQFEPELGAEKSGAGWQWPDGMLGELRVLSRNSEKYGGPSFWK